MPEKNSNKVPFSENDIATLVQRYDATILLTLLQEIAHYPDTKKFDWNELVKKTSTGISNPREYQMLWRYLAYHDSLNQIFEEADQPVDDDSDLDCEPESLASVSVESASESSACVKVMIASRTLSESTPSSSTIEAPLTVYLPVCCSSRTPKENSQPSDLMGQASISFPVTVHRQTLPTVSSTDALETKGLVGGTMASKRKRKAWSEEEDNLLRAAVQRLGEGNWATMAKGDDFPVKRSATQLAQRWSTLRKKDCSTNTGTNVTNTQYTTAEQLATRHSLSLALDMPFKKLTAPGMTNPNPGRTSTSIKNQVQSRNATEVSTVRSSVPAQRPSQQAVLGSCGSPAKSKLASESSVSKCNTIPGPSQQAVLGSCGSPAKFKLASENPVSKCNAISGRELKPAIVHSGPQTVSRPNTPTVSRPNAPTVSRPNAPTVSRPNTLPQFKVAQAKNVVHPVPAGSSLTKTPISAGLPSVQKDKHVTSVQEEVKRVSDLGSTPKEKVKEEETFALTTQSQVDSKLDKAKLELDKAKSMPGEKILENKVVVSQNPRGCEEQGSVQNSNLIPKKAATENGNDKVNKESQVQNQDKKTNSSNGSSNQQNMHQKQVHLPKQDERLQGLEQPK